MTIDNNLSEEENKSINELRRRLKDDLDPELYDDDYYLLKFLKARDMNLDNAEKMLRKHLEWRKQYDIKNILKFKKLEVQEKYISNIFLGYDKEGCVIRYSPVGNLDFPGVISSCTREEILKHLLYEIEIETHELKKQSKKLGKNIDKCVYIHNFEHFSFATATNKKFIQFAMNLVGHFMNNYPERLKIAFVINTPAYFNIIFSIVKSLIPVTILRKIHLYSDDSYKEDILQVIDADVLPKFLGGNRTDPDGNPLCLSIIDHGGKRVPESYYLCKNRKRLPTLPGVKKVTLPRAAFHEVFLKVKVPGSFLEWEFETKCRDIGFGLFYQEIVNGQEKLAEIIPIQRIDTEQYPETGTFRCESAGTYVILFDNTYSWVRTKDIFYRAKIVTPKEHEAEVKL